MKMKRLQAVSSLIPGIFMAFLVMSCSSAYYGAMDRVGVHKRDILVDRVLKSREAQSEAQVQFKSALEQFGSVVKLEETDLKKAYDKLSKEYEKSENAAGKVSDRIDAVESVADALFEEWEKELKLYESKELRQSSKEQLTATRTRYKEMLDVMRQAEKSMEPVLKSFHDNVLFLKHNLNAQAIGSLKGEFAELEGQISKLIGDMNQAIATSDKFIADLKK